MNDPWYRATCNENRLSLRNMYEFEDLGNPENRTHLKKPMSKKERQEAGLQRWVPDVDYGGEDQGGNDSNYRQRQPKAKAQRTAKSGKDDSGWKSGSWPSAGRDLQWGTSAEYKDDWWYQ